MTTAHIGDSGIVLNGEPDDEGVLWEWQEGADPWIAPDPREETGDLPFAHGSWNATAYYQARMQDLSVMVTAPTHAGLHRAHDRWRAAIGLKPFRFQVAEPHLTRWAMMRRRGPLPWKEELGGDEEPGAAFATTSLALVGDDPLIYAEQQLSITTGFPSTIGGLQWPTAWPTSWDAEVESGVLVLDNPGNEHADILWRIDGPVSRPRILDPVSGESFTLALDLVAGEWVTVDSATHQVLLLGQQGASRRPQWSGKWLTVPPGGRAFVFAGAAGSAPASATASWWPTWI